MVLRHGMTSLVGWSAVQMGQISWESRPHKWVNEFYSPRLTRTEQGGYSNRIFEQNQWLLTDKLSILFASLHTIHTNTLKHRKTRLSSACRDTPSALHLASCLGWKQCRQQGPMQARRWKVSAFHSTRCCEWGLAPENSSGLKKQQEKWEFTLPWRSQY